MLNSVEHEILNAHKYKNIKKFGQFKAQLSLECYFSPLIHVKMPTTVGILTFMSGKNSYSVVLSMKKSLITSGPGLWQHLYTSDRVLLYLLFFLQAVKAACGKNLLKNPSAKGN